MPGLDSFRPWAPESSVQELFKSFITPAFNAALSDVIATASATWAACESLEFAKDQLDYYRERHAVGTLEESALWQHAKRLVEARQTNEAKRVEYVQALHTLSKRWGGERW